MKTNFFKGVTTADCIYCKTEYPLNEPDFRFINRHGWGCCASCWSLDMPNHTGVYVPPAPMQVQQIADVLVNNVIDYQIRNVYGRENIYIMSEHAKLIETLTRRKTVDHTDLKALEAISQHNKNFAK